MNSSLTRVRVTNYKSIGACDVSLGPLTLLIGPNAAGKSNFLDALAFVAEALTTTPQQAIETRGGGAALLPRPPDGAGNSFSILIDLELPGAEPGQSAQCTYGFEIAPTTPRRHYSFEVVSETCSLQWEDRTDRFQVFRGAVLDTSSPVLKPTIELDRLYLPVAAARPAFAPLFQALRGMLFYNFDPATLRLPRPRAEGPTLGRRGEHLADVLGALTADHPEVKERLDAYLAAVAPGIEGVDRRTAGTYSTVELRQRNGSDGEPIRFGPESMSDGTIRAAGVLAALFQPRVLGGHTPLVSIEEPETAWHPAVAGVLYDALAEASEHVQVLVATQSADLIDRRDLDPAILRTVVRREGRTVIGNLNVAKLRPSELRSTPGELLRRGVLCSLVPASARSSAGRRPAGPRKAGRAGTRPRAFRRQNSVHLLVAAGRIPPGTELIFQGETAEERQALAAWLEEDPRRSRAEWVNDRSKPLRWLVDGLSYSPSALVEHMWELAGWGQSRSAANATEQWFLPGEGSLFTLAEEVLRQQSRQGV